MSISIGDWTFEHVNYDRGADVLYLRLGEPVPVVCETTPEGHALCFSRDTGEFFGVDIVGPRHILERGQRIEVTLPRKQDATEVVAAVV